MVDLKDLPAPLRLLVLLRNTVLYLGVLAYAVGALVVGSTLGREIGAILLIACLIIGFRLARSRFAKPFS